MKNIDQEIETSVNYRFTIAPAELVESFSNNEEWCKFSRETSQKTLENMGCKVVESHNIVPLLLRASLANLIAGTTVTPTFKANKIAMGSNSATPTNADLTLAAETIRQDFTNRYAVDNVAYLDKFRGTGDVSGNTYLEAGVFVDGTASANTGYLLSRITMNETISAGETLTINISFTIS